MINLPAFLRNCNVLIILITTLLGVTVNAWAVSSPRYHWRSFTTQTTQRGLVGNDVRAIVQHSNGDIWFATSAGVSQYNGLWRRFTIREGLADNDATGIVEADDGSIWIGTLNGISIAYISPDFPFEILQWQSFHTDDGLIDNRIFSIAKDADGQIWVGTPVGASVFDGEQWIHHQEPEVGLSRGVTAIYKDSQENMWFGIRRSSTALSAVGVWDGAHWTVFTVADGLPNGDIYAFAEDSAGNIWVGTSDGAARFEAADEAADGASPRKLRPDGSNWDIFSAANGLTGNNIQAMMLDRSGQLWFGTSTGVSIASSEVDQPFAAHALSFMTVEGLVSDNIQAMCEDSDGRLWFGTSSGGVNFSDRSWQTFTTGSSLPDNVITALATDRDGNLWVGTRNGLYKYNRSISQQLAIGPTSNGLIWGTFTLIDGPPSNDIRALAVDKEGNLWVGTDKGIGVFDGISFFQYYTQRDGLSGNSVHALTVDSAGNVWAGTGLLIPEDDALGLFGGLSKFDGNNWIRMPFQGATVSTLFEDRGGNIWIGTFSAGVTVLKGGNPPSIPPLIKGGRGDFTTADGLPSNKISAIIEDVAGRIWIGTANGISIFSIEGGLQAVITTDDGLIDNRIQTLFYSSTGTIWVGTASGVSVAVVDANSDIRDITWTTLTMDDGLASNDISVILEDNDGYIWLGTNDGSGLTRHVREQTAPRTRIIRGPRGIVGERNVMFEYEGGDASTPINELRYSHRIDSSIEPGDWTPLTQRNSVSFSNLTDRTDYEFFVRAVDKYGNIGVADSARIHVDAEPPIADIIDPTQNQVIGGIYEIMGTAMDEPDFKEYKIETANYSYSSSEPVNEGLLASWDVSNLTDGKYTIKLSAWDMKNGPHDIEHTRDDLVSVIVDNTPPTVEIINPKSGVTVNGKIDIYARITDVHPDSYTFKYTQKGTPEQQIRVGMFAEGLGTHGTASEEPVKFTWDSSSVYGETTIILEGEDAAGNVGVARLQLYLDNNTALPITSITKPVDGQVLREDVAIIGTVNDSTLQEFTLAYALEANKADFIRIKGGEFPIRNDVLATWHTAGLPDGNYILRLAAKDDNGYSNETAITVTVDNTPPIVLIDSPADGEIMKSSRHTEIHGTAMDDNFISYTIEYVLAGAPIATETQWILIDEKKEEMLGGVLGDWNTSSFEGEYWLRVTARDEAGWNQSDVVMITIDDTAPLVEIARPEDGAIVSDTVEIIGTVNDNKLARYEIIVYEKSAPNEWQKIPFGEINPATLKENSLLALWHTATEGEVPVNGEYRIRLTAWDKSNHENSTERNVIVDNKTPEAVIEQPKPYQQVREEIRLIGTADDANFTKYIVEYGKGEHPTEWNVVSETPFLQQQRDNLLAVWNARSNVGVYTLRLRVFDVVGHENSAQATIIVNDLILREQGGTVTDNNAIVTLTIPPNSLNASTAITINPVTNDERSESAKLLFIERWAAPAGYTHTGIAYDFEPMIRLRNIKPATITFSYVDADINLAQYEALTLSFWDKKRERFQIVGGTVNTTRGTIATPITTLGRYTLMRMDAPLESNTDAVLSQLTCQPPLFSPQRGKSTRISFHLSQPAAVAVKIYNMAARLRRVLTHDTLMYKSGVLEWDGRDDNQHIVPGGLYIVTVTVAGHSAQKRVIVWND